MVYEAIDVKIVFRGIMRAREVMINDANGRIASNQNFRD